METKLTLKLDKAIISRAKTYAKKKQISLSKMVELYFKSLTEEDGKPEKKYSPLVQELSGIIDLNKENNIKDDYTNYLNEKYK